MTATSDSAYIVSNQVRIHHVDDDWNLIFTADEYGTVTVAHAQGTPVTPNENPKKVVDILSSKRLPNYTNLHIPKDCLQHFIDALEQFKHAPPTP